MYGTVKSGHPTDTTFGNSVRSAAYAAFLTDNEKLGKFVVAGDDMLITCKPEQLSALESRMQRFYDREISIIPKALGQLCKGYTKGDITTISYLSKQYQNLHGVTCIRPYDRILYKQSLNKS